MMVEQTARKGCDSQVPLINSSWDYNASIIYMILSILLGFMADGASMMISWSHQPACSTISITNSPGVNTAFDLTPRSLSLHMKTSNLPAKEMGPLYP